MFAKFSYSQFDQLCDDFWDTPDSELVNAATTEFGVTDTNAMMATYYFVCDT